MKSYGSFAELREELNANSITCVDIVQGFLDRIEETRELNAFLRVYVEESLERAKEIDAKIKDHTAGRLAGMVVGIKDNICYKDHGVGAASKILEGFESVYNATVVQRLLDEDAIIIGHLNCDEFAMGSSNENSAYGPVLNPHDKSLVPGGSSGGSCAAVASGLCMVALGTDTGGSIRQPASFCGVVGLKPTYGRVSRYGLIAYGSSLDQIGPITNNVSDSALVLEIMAGEDENDPTTSGKEVTEYAQLTGRGRKPRIAILQDCMEREGLDNEIKTRLENIFDELRSDEYDLQSVDFPYLDYMVPTYHVLANAEASSNLSRYDGIHFGYRSPEAHDLESTYSMSRTEGFGTEVKRRIMLGTFVLSAGYYDAYYSRAQKVRRVIKDKTDQILKDYDFIVLPSSPSTAFPIGQNSDNPIALYLQDIFTIQANLSGNPAISLPLGKHSNGLPFGIQLIGRNFEENDLLSFSEEMMSRFKV